MREEGFAALAARSAQVRNEHRLLLEGLKAFEQRLLELVHGLAIRACSKHILLEEFNDNEGEPIGHIIGFMGFDGRELYVAAKEEPHPSWEDDNYTVHPVDQVGIEWQRRLCHPDVLNSLLHELVVELDKDLHQTAPLVASLAHYGAVEKAKIDADIDAYFDGTVLYEFWLKARKAVDSDPELSITLSCSHLETALKKCLKMLGAVDYEDEPVTGLMNKLMKRLRRGDVMDEHTKQMLNGALTVCHGIATNRNQKSVAHGKSEGYIQPTADLAQTLNHLAGVISVFVIKHTNLLKAQHSV
ncbi:abortive infection family protein [Pseudomonas putida]|uniref:abortive infection family protein n=1 Tax=Pseudomonas putida TaxID=303 RepID=UPI00226FD311|nr:abortive infection family protein [Pseudomonas putida]WAB99738.1 abortive infection family protein [Pseudomonas putida]